RGALADPRVRKAISMGIDENALVADVLLGHGQPGRDTWIHPQSPWAEPGAGHQYDPAAAAAALDGAGYTQRDGDGVRRSAAGVRLELNVMVSAVEPIHIRAAQLASRQLQDVGVKLNVVPMDPAAMAAQRNLIAPKYDAFISVLESHAHADPDALYFFFHSPGKGAVNAAFGGWSNPVFDQATERAKVATDLTQRKQLLDQAQNVFAQDAPAVVLFYPDGMYAFRPSAYRGGISEAGPGFFPKRSSLSGHANPTAVANRTTGTSTVPVGVLSAAGVAVVLVAATSLAVVRRRRALAYED